MANAIKCQEPKYGSNNRISDSKAVNAFYLKFRKYCIQPVPGGRWRILMLNFRTGYYCQYESSSIKGAFRLYKKATLTSEVYRGPDDGRINPKLFISRSKAE